MLYSRYGGGAKDIIESEFEFGVQILNKAMEKKTDEELFERWIHGYQEKMSFEEFKRELRVKAPSPQPIVEKTEKETFDIVRKILEMR